MSERENKLQQFGHLLAELQEISGDLILASKFQMLLEEENKQLQRENRALKKEIELLKVDSSKDSIRPIQKLTLEDNILRVVKKLEKKQPPSIREIANYVSTPAGEREILRQTVTNLVQAGLLIENAIGKTHRYTTKEEEN